MNAKEARDLAIENKDKWKEIEAAAREAALAEMVQLVSDEAKKGLFSVNLPRDLNYLEQEHFENLGYTYKHARYNGKVIEFHACINW